MITLITIFYTFLFSINAPIQLDCDNKLKALNYIYEYDQEPTMLQSNARGAYKYSRHRNINDTIPRKVKLEVKSMYNCFKLALEADTNKVLFISYYPLFKGEIKKTKPNEVPASPDEMKDRSRSLNISGLVDYHHLKNVKVYYSTFHQEQNTTSRYKVELLDKTDSKVKFGSLYLYKYIKVDKCDTCPF